MTKLRKKSDIFNFSNNFLFVIVYMLDRHKYMQIDVSIHPHNKIRFAIIRFFHYLVHLSRSPIQLLDWLPLLFLETRIQLLLLIIFITFGKHLVLLFYNVHIRLCPLVLLLPPFLHWFIEHHHIFLVEHYFLRSCSRYLVQLLSILGISFYCYVVFLLLSEMLVKVPSKNFANIGYEPVLTDKFFKLFGKFLNVNSFQKGVVIILKLLFPLFDELFVDKDLLGREFRKFPLQGSFLTLRVDGQHATIPLFKCPALLLLGIEHLHFTGLT